VAEYEGNPVADALMAAITDEPLTDQARSDAEFMARHRAAAADVALLREQLSVIGDALADAGKVSEPARPARKPRKARNRRPAGAPKKRSRHPGALAVTLGSLAAAVVASGIVGMGWLIAQGGGVGGSNDAASSKAGSGGGSSVEGPGYLACARLVVEGTVTEVEPVPGAEQDRITLHVDRSYKPAKGKDQVTFVMDTVIDPRPHKGQHALVGIRTGAAMPDRWVTAEKDIARDREWILKALPKAAGLACK
jgi:hypothetical protein